MKEQWDLPLLSTVQCSNASRRLNPGLLRLCEPLFQGLCFPIAITPATCMCALSLLSCRPSYLVIHSSKVVLSTSTRVLLKVLSCFPQTRTPPFSVSVSIWTQKDKAYYPLESRKAIMVYPDKKPSCKWIPFLLPFRKSLKASWSDSQKTYKVTEVPFLARREAHSTTVMGWRGEALRYCAFHALFH